ncbi:MAG TPA: hypothetical protein VH157_14945 [Bryobacteraceae bacterium]|nr:hypothetical protein [Bryobacteraceae bacterium]
MNLNDVMTQEREALMAEYAFPQDFAKTQIPPYCAVPDVDVLKRTPSGIRIRYPIRIESLHLEKPEQAFVQICDGLKYKFLWAHVDNEKYRDDYISFVRKFHALLLSDLPGNLHVDHLYNRARAKDMQLPFVRMILLPSSINVSHGAGYEKQRTVGGIGKAGRERGIDEIVLMKLWGISSPRKNAPLTPEMQAHLDRMSILFSIPRAELERNIRELMDVAAFRPGK